MRKWSAPRHDDQLALANGVYVHSDRPDEFGPRAFLVVNLVWEERETSFLSDAATQWGMAPWALSIARERMRLAPLGDWEQLLELHGSAMGLVGQACREREPESHGVGGLLLLRSALRMEGLGRGKNLNIELARHCLRQEIERDADIRDAKAKAYAAEHPDWRPSPQPMGRGAGAA